MGGRIMAKISRPIVEYREIIRSSGMIPADYSPPKRTIKRFIRLLKGIDDVRIANMTDYPLHEILLIAFLAILGNSSTWNEIERFGKMKEKWLRKFLALENGIPSHDTFRRVFALIDPVQLERTTVFFLMENMDKIKKSLSLKNGGKRLICVDGKEERGTGRKYDSDEKQSNLQLLHVYDASHGVCLFSQPIKEKTNEIPTAQDILKGLQLKGTIVSFDALHTQKKTVEIIAAGQGDYIGALKGNQAVCFNEVADYFTEERKKRIREKGVHYYKTLDKAHSQVETRRFYLTTSINWFEDKEKWEHLRGFLCYETTVYDTITKKETRECRYYMTSMKDVKLCAEAARGHWSVEAQLHWHLDSNMGEDDNTTTDKNAFTNLSIMNKLALSLYKLAQPLMDNESIRMIRKIFSWGYEESIALLLNSFDEKVLKQALESVNVKKTK